jgi:hypothetical protein
VKQIEEPEPLPVQLLDRRGIPPVLVEFPIRIHSQLGECVREGLKQEEYQEHDLKYHGHLQLQIEFEEGCVHVCADNWDYILGYDEILHELKRNNKVVLRFYYHIHCETKGV